MLAQHLRHDHLREKHLVDLVQKLPRHLQFEFLGLMKFNRNHESFAAHLLDEGMLFAQHVDLVHEQRAHFRRIFDQIFGIDHFE